MNKSMGCFVASLLGLVACTVEHYDDGNCHSDPVDVGADFGGTHSLAGSTSSAGHGSTAGGSTTGGAASTQAGASNGGAAGKTTTDGGSSQATDGGDSGQAGDGETTTPIASPTPCQSEHDCSPGYNCDLDVHQCLPAAEETCGELDTELACTHRTDCAPVYGGVNCSCGKDCECHGGEAGCVCQSFEFFICQDAK